MPIKILHIVSAIGTGGISSVILNYYKYMDRDKVHFDFIVTSDELGINAHLLKELGSEIFILPKKAENMKEYIKQLSEIIKNGGYNIVHAHQNSNSFIPLMIAKRAGAKIRIAHAHTSNASKKSLRAKLIRTLSYIANTFAVTDYIACGKLAGQDIFGRNRFEKSKNAFVLNNAVTIDKFKFSEEIRKSKRTEMGWDNKLVVGHVGRLSSEKNQLFLVDIFEELLKLNPDSLLCICGDGERREEVENYINKKELKNKVLLLGNRSDVPDLLSAFDSFVLPSLFEGLPVVGVEVISNGLPCVMSDVITDEFDKYKKINYISLDEPASFWALEILKESKKGHDENMASLMKKAGYDIKDNAKILENFYIDKVKK